MAAPKVFIDGSSVSITDVEAVARDRAKVALAEAARRRLRAGRHVVEQALGRGDVMYGVNTGFGSLSRTRIDEASVREVQRNLVRSHAAGVGSALPEEDVRATMFVLLASLARGASGVRVEVAEALVAALNQGVWPYVPEVGSVGASGDLAPLSHVALALLGEGEAFFEGVRTPAGDVLARLGLRPLQLEAKEGLALINGTHFMTGRGALVCAEIDRLLRAACVATAMSIDACRATDAFLDERVHALRPHPGQIEVARRLREALAGSEIVKSHRRGDPRVQDPYSFRCAPQVLGAVFDAVAFVRSVVERELGAVTDNPLVFESSASRPEEADFVSAGNFHGMPLAVAFDLVGIALCHVAGISERRIYFMLSASDAQNPLRQHLSPKPGLHSGLMIAQYTAAACVNEIAGLATPASVTNLPTSAGVEDYNSFGPRSVAKARQALARTTSVIAIELLCAAEALEYQRPLHSGAGVEAAHALVRAAVSMRTEDRPLSPDVFRLEELIRSGVFSVDAGDREAIGGPAPH